jgi:hypothetical protein
MSITRQYLIEVSLDAVTLRRVEVTSPTGIPGQLVEGIYIPLGVHPPDLMLSLPPTSLPTNNWVRLRLLSAQDVPTPLRIIEVLKPE